MISSPNNDHLPLCVPLALLLGLFSLEPQMAVNFKKIKLQLHSSPLFLYFANKLRNKDPN